MSEEKKYYTFTKKFWKIFAPFYDLAVIIISKVRYKVVKLIEPEVKHDAKILDVGTGTGMQAYAFAKKGYNVTGVDISEAMLKIAKRKNKYENARFQLSDATNLPFNDSDFDISCASFVLHDMPASIIEKTLSEMKRVTKADGRIIIVEYGLPENPVWRFIIYNLIRLYEIKYYTSFVRSDFESLLSKSGINIEAEHKLFYGAAKILKCKIV